MAKESKIEKMLTNMAVMQTDIAYIKKRLDRINGNLEDYPVYKSRVDSLEGTMAEIAKMVSGIKIKIWSVAGLIGGLCGFVGVLIGKFL